MNKVVISEKIKTLVDNIVNDKYDDSNKLVILTHKNCYDGSGSVLAILDTLGLLDRKNMVINTANVVIEFVQYGELKSKPYYTGVCAYRNVIMADFSFPEEYMEAINKIAKNFIMIDHHETAVKKLSHLDYVILDKEFSGATLSWYVLNYDKNPNNIPKLLEYIEDRDIWKWDLPDSRAISAYISLYDPKDLYRLFNAMTILDNTNPAKRDDIINIGMHILKYQDNEITKIKERVIVVEDNRFFDVTDVYHDFELIPLVNTRSLISEKGEALSEYIFTAAAMFFITTDSLVVSLRSNENNPDAINVEKIARHHGGGGHPHAAGFSYKLKDIYMDIFLEKGKIVKRSFWNDIKIMLGKM